MKSLHWNRLAAVCLLGAIALSNSNALAMDLDQAIRRQGDEASQILTTLGHSEKSLNVKISNEKMKIALLPKSCK